MPAIPPVEEILSHLIRARTENPPGAETAAVSYLKGLFDRFGIPNQVLAPSPGRESIIATWGQGGRSLLFLSHLDVVPAGEGWDFDPFGGEIKNGHVLGRGAMDCKGLTAAETHAFLHFSQEQQRAGRLIFAATADEETGGRLGVEFLMAQHPELLRADFAINEGGEEPIPIGKQVVYFIQVGEKGTAWTKLNTRGVSCHGALPDLGDNAVVKMASALKGLGSYRAQPVLIPETRYLISELARLLGRPAEITPENVDQIIAAFPERAFVAYLKALTRMTISPNTVCGGTKTNIVPDSCEADVDIRILPGQELNFVTEELKRLGGPDIEIKVPNFNPPSFSTSASPYYDLTAKTMKEVVGTEVCLPCLSAGATDSRFLRRAGMPAYGISVLAPDFDPKLRETVHGRNERIDIKSLELKARFLLRLAEKYLAQPA